MSPKGGNQNKEGNDCIRELTQYRGDEYAIDATNDTYNSSNRSVSSHGTKSGATD
ncbi:hypothetical protein WVIC16_130100 [Weissella viridescens]|nr:hypothetical protein WVIC16_130100 [Weissella viridescens]